MSSSEQSDKQMWHQRYRVRERLGLAKAALQGWDAHLPAHENQVSNPSVLSKDGRHYCPPSQQLIAAERLAGTRSNGIREREAIKIRLLRQWNGK